VFSVYESVHGCDPLNVAVNCSSKLLVWLADVAEEKLKIDSTYIIWIIFDPTRLSCDGSSKSKYVYNGTCLLT